MVSINCQHPDAFSTSSLPNPDDESKLALLRQPRADSIVPRSASKRNDEVRRIEREGTELLIAYSESRSDQNPQGNPVILARLYASQKKSLSNFARLKGIPENDAEDIISNSFVNLMVRGNFDPSKGDIKYLYRLFDNTCTDFYRRSQARLQVTNFTDFTPSEALHADLEFENILDSGSLPGIDHAVRNEQISLVQQGLSELDDGPAVDALREYYYEGKKVKDIAKSSKTAVGTVKSRLLRGKALLYGLLHRYGL